MSRVTTIILLLAATFSFCCAQPNLPSGVKENIEMRVKNGQNIGMVIGMVDEGGTSYYAFGVKSLKTNEPVDENSVFEIGSISKTFTGILLANKVIKGEMKLEDPLQMYLPDGITAPTRNGESISLVHLSNHRSGLPRMPTNFTPSNVNNPYADYDEKLMFEFLTNYELTRDIGSIYEYSNYAAGLLGHVMAMNSDKTYEELMVDVIAKPLGMKNTRIVLTDKMKASLATGHNQGVEVENWDLTSLAGAGAIRSTVVDMTKYISYNLGLKTSKLSEAFDLSHENSWKENSSPIVGLGWHTTVMNDMSIVWHNGGTGGYRAFAGFIKDQKKGVVILTNSTDGSPDDLGLRLLNPSAPMREVKPSIRVKLDEVIKENGLDEGIKAYRELKSNNSNDYEFGETELARLGSQYLAAGQSEKAIAILELNVEAYPESAVVFNSLADAHQELGNKEQAIENYKKSLSLNPGNQNASDKLKELGVDPDSVTGEIEVSNEILDLYVGKYELVPTFILTVVRKENQLYVQATGQPEFPVFPKEENVFFYKVVEAQLTFTKGDDGTIQGVTLFQAGREMPARKIE